MIITIHPDNTVDVKGGQTINSTHSHKASSEFIKKIAEALPYKGAMDFAGKETMVFNSQTAKVIVGDREYFPGDDISGESDDAQAFCNTAWDNGGRRIFEAIQRLRELKNGRHND